MKACVPHSLAVNVSCVACVLLAFSMARSEEDQSIQDHTEIELEEFGISPVLPRKDSKTGFIVGGRNPTSSIEKLTEINGKEIADLEKVMRPGESSTAGFLGKGESLLHVMAVDNKYVVDRMGMTHQELARHLHAMGAIWRLQLREKQSGSPFLYHGRKYKVSGVATRGFQPSPFGDGTKSGANVTVENLDNGATLEYGLLVPFMVERYGFYEGKGTSYRVNPGDIDKVFDFLKPKKD